MARAITGFWLANNLNCRERLGFLSRCSTVTSFVWCIAKISDYLYNHTPCDIIMLDFAGAFKKVSHSFISQAAPATVIGPSSTMDC